MNKKDKSIWKSLSNEIKKKLFKKVFDSADFPENPQSWQINEIKKQDDEGLFGDYKNKK